MHPLPRRTLRRLLAQYGPTLLDDPARVDALLADLCGPHHRERFLLVHALRERIPAELLAQPHVGAVHGRRLSQRLQQRYGFSDEAAQWAVESWSLALDLAPLNPNTLRDGSHMVLSDCPQRTLRKLLTDYGPALLNEPARVDALLADLCGPYPRERFLLVHALRERIPTELLLPHAPRKRFLAEPLTQPQGATIYGQRPSQRLQSQYGFSAEAAQWAVEGCSLALNITPPAQDLTPADKPFGPVEEIMLQILKHDPRTEAWVSAEVLARQKAEERDAAEAAVRQKAGERDAAEVLARQKAEERNAAEAAARQKAEERDAAEVLARQKAEERNAAEAAARQKAKEQVAAEAAVRQKAKEQVAAEATALQKEEEREAAEATARQKAKEQVAAKATALQKAEVRVAAEAAARQQAEKQASPRQRGWLGMLWLWLGFMGFMGLIGMLELEEALIGMVMGLMGMGLMVMGLMGLMGMGLMGLMGMVMGLMGLLWLGLGRVLMGTMGMMGRLSPRQRRWLGMLWLWLGFMGVMGLIGNLELEAALTGMLMGLMGMLWLWLGRVLLGLLGRILRTVVQ